MSRFYGLRQKDVFTSQRCASTYTEREQIGITFSVIPPAPTLLAIVPFFHRAAVSFLIQKKPVKKVYGFLFYMKLQLSYGSRANAATSLSSFATRKIPSVAMEITFKVSAKAAFPMPFI